MYRKFIIGNNISCNHGRFRSHSKVSKIVEELKNIS